MPLRFLILMSVMCSFYLHGGDESGYIQIKCTPGVQIFLDGAFCGVTSVDLNGLILQGVKPGTRKIKAVRDGYQAQEKMVNVDAGQVVLFEVEPFRPKLVIKQEGEVSKANVNLRVGSLIVQSLPVECRIVIEELGIDDKKTKDKWNAEGVPVGRYNIIAFGLSKKLIYMTEVEENKTTRIFFNFANGKVEDLEAEKKKKMADRIASAEQTFLFAYRYKAAGDWQKVVDLLRPLNFDVELYGNKALVFNEEKNSLILEAEKSLEAKEKLNMILNEIKALIADGKFSKAQDKITIATSLIGSHDQNSRARLDSLKILLKEEKVIVKNKNVYESNSRDITYKKESKKDNVLLFDGYFENKLFGTDEIELDGDKYVVQCSKNDYTNGKKEITCVFDKSTWKTRKLLWGAKFTKRDATDIEFVKYGYKVRAKYNTDKGCPKDKKWHVTIVRDTP